MRPVGWLLVLAVSLTLPAGAAGEPAALQIRALRAPGMTAVQAPDRRTGTAGHPLDYPLRVVVTDPRGVPVSDVEVRFDAIGELSGGWPGPLITRTDGDGMATVQAVLGDKPGRFFVGAWPGEAGAPLLFEIDSRARAWVVQLTIGLLGGIGLFIFGMERMSKALQKVAGDHLRTWLRVLTPNPYLAALVGCGLTAAVQSSSVTTVMVIGLVQAEVMSLTQAVGVIFGANVGTTVTTQIIAFQIGRLGLFFVAAGVPLMLAARRGKIRQLGTLLVGFGLLLFGMELMTEAMRPLRTLPAFVHWLASLSEPIVAIVAGALVTVILQSSAAVSGIVIAIAAHGILPLETAIGVIFGANVGTCVKAGVAAVGKSREAMRVAVAHLLFNVIAVGVLVWFLPQFAEAVRWLSPGDGGAAAGPREVANAHTLFNLLAATVFLPLSRPFAAMLRRLVPDRKEEPLFQVRYLDASFLDSPTQALEAVRQEARRMGATIDEMLAEIPDALFKQDTRAMRDLAAKDDLIDFLDRAITDYLRLISGEDLGSSHAAQALAAIGVINEIEHVGDVIEVDFGHLVHHLRRRGATFTVEGRMEIVHLTETVRKLVAQAIESFATQDRQLAANVVAQKAHLQALEEGSRLAHLRRVQRAVADSVATRGHHNDVLNCLQRIAHHARNIARIVTGEAGSERREAPVLWVAAAELAEYEAGSGRAPHADTSSNSS